MKESQFSHVECFGRRPSSRKTGGRSMEGVAREAERVHGYCGHVERPRPPKILFGCRPSDAVRTAAERAEKAADAHGRKLRADALVYLAGVASYPVAWTRIRGNKPEAERLRRWLAYLLEHLKAQYGAALCYALLHDDEAFPHVHWGVVPELEPGSRLRISTVHPGRAAYESARMAGGNNIAGQRAYLQAMVKWQDDLHLAVYAPVGIGRVGPKRQRLTLSERKAREKAEAALARTLDAEEAIKAKWRAEIRIDVEQSFAEAQMHQGRLAQELRAELQSAKAKLAESETKNADLEHELAQLLAKFFAPGRRSLPNS